MKLYSAIFCCSFLLSLTNHKEYEFYAKINVSYIIQFTELHNSLSKIGILFTDDTSPQRWNDQSVINYCELLWERFVKLCSEGDKAQIHESISARVIKPNFRPSQHINQANFAAICDPSRCHTRIWFTHGRWSRRLPFIRNLFLYNSLQCVPIGIYLSRIYISLKNLDFSSLIILKEFQLILIKFNNSYNVHFLNIS